MGITVVTGANLSAGGNAATGFQPAAEGGADFSALLGLQLVPPQTLDLQLQAASPSTGEKEGIGVQDPASLLSAAGLLPALMAGANQAAPGSPRASGGDTGAGLLAKATAEGSRKAATLETAARGAELLDARSGQPSALEGDRILFQESFQSSRPGNSALADAARIAAEAQSGANTPSNFAATLAAQAAAARPMQQESATAAPQISVPLQDGRWAQDFSEKVVWLARNDQQTAQISINPPQLGPMQITLNLAGDQVSAIFASPHAEVRQAIQDAMPQLREMLAGAGINLGQANVGAQLPQQNSGTPQQSSDSSRFGSDNAILHGDSGHGANSPPQPVRSGRGMVDLFA